MPEDDFFFFMGQKIISPKEAETGAGIKALIKAAIPTFDPTHTLVLEGQGHHPDRVIQDGERVSLEVRHDEPAKHFFSKPPTNFGVL